MTDTKTKEILALAATDRTALRNAGWTPTTLINAGWTPTDLINAGWTPTDLINAGWTPTDLRNAGWTPTDLINAGWTPTTLINAGWTPTDLKEFDDIPVIENVYSRLFEDIQTKKRKFSQATFGPNGAPTPEPNLCGTPMCTAGSLVSMAGDIGWKLKTKYGFETAARLIHDRAHPGWPPQNYGGIPDAWALAWIETMAEHEKNGTKPVGYVEPLEVQE